MVILRILVQCCLTWDKILDSVCNGAGSIFRGRSFSILNISSVLLRAGEGRWQMHDFFFDITKEIHDYEFFLCLTRSKLVLKMREIFVTKRFHSFFQVKIFQMEKSARNLIQNASMFGLISSVKFQTLVIVRTGKSKKIHMLKSFFF